MDIEVGSFVVIDGQLMEVLGLDPNGYVLIRRGKTLELEWIDFYLVEFIDPNKDGESLLTALGSLSNHEEPSEEKSKSPERPEKEAPDTVFLFGRSGRSHLHQEGPHS